MEQGGVVDTVIDSFSGGARAEYIGISVARDAVCVAWISVKQFDQTTGGAWTGDIGYECGQAWYANKEMAGYVDDDETEEYIPRCTWLDAALKEDTESASLKFDTTAYGKKVKDTVDNKDACKYTLWGEDDAPISGTFKISLKNEKLSKFLQVLQESAPTALVALGWNTSSSSQI